MGKISFMIGLPRSGKSTFAEKWKNEKPNRVVLNGDNFRYAIYNKRFQVIGEELVKSSLITAARALYISGYDVLIDETHTTTSNILSVLAIDEDATAYFIKTPSEVCKQRAIACGQEDLVPVIQRMTENLVITVQEMDSGRLTINRFEVVDV
jgi:predicted kinase